MIAEDVRLRKDFASIAERFNASVMPEPNTGCFLWAGSGQGKRREYGGFTYGSRQIDRRHVGAHRFAYEMVNGPISSGLQVMHKCDVPCCVNPDHLVVGTRFDNMRDCARKRRVGYNKSAGEGNGRAKLTLAAVNGIRADSRPRTVIAKQYRVSATTISAIKNGKIWQFSGPKFAKYKSQ